MTSVDSFLVEHDFANLCVALVMTDPQIRERHTRFCP
jgi:hypothetical protein